MKKKILIVLFVLLFILTGCGNKTEEKDDNNDNVVKWRDLSEEELNSVLNTIDDLKYLDYYGKSFKPSELTNQEVLRFVSSLIGEVDGVKFSDLANMADEYLGFSLEPENIICVTHYNILGTSSDLYLYDSSTGTYKYNDNHDGHGGGGFESMIVNKYIDSKTDGENVEVNVYKAFSDILGDITGETYAYYATYEDAGNGENALFSNSTYEDATTNLDNLGDSDKLVKYTYKFVLKDGKYVLTEYIINK